MSLFQMATAWWNRKDQLQEAVEMLSRECLAGVRDRLSQRVYQMSRYESRGYVRARAALVVQNVVEMAVQRERVPAELTRQIQSEVLQTTTQLVHQQLVSQPWRVAGRRAA